MKFLKIFLTITFLCATQVKVLAQTKPNYTLAAQKIIYYLTSEKYDSVYFSFSNDVKRQFDAEQVEGLWNSLTFTYGKFKEIGSTKTTQSDSLVITYTPLKFAKSSLVLKLVLDKEVLVAGIFIEPNTIEYNQPAYSIATNFYNIKTKTFVNGYENNGVLSIPNTTKKVPLVIIVGGSGPTDMDGSIGPNKPYRDIAEGLASNSIAVYRYNKRTKAFAAKMALSKNEITVKEEYLDDLKSIVKAAKKFDNIDSKKIILICHSQAGYLMPYFAKNIKGIKGFIGLAAGFRSMQEIFVEQLNYILSITESEQEKVLLNALLVKANYAKNKLTKDSPKDSLIPGLTAHYLLDLQSKSPQKLQKYLLQKPVLNIRGSADYQVSEKDLAGWNAILGSNKNYTFKTYPNLNHVFIKVNAEGKYCKPKDYEMPGNVDIDVITDLIYWIWMLK